MQCAPASHTACMTTVRQTKAQAQVTQKKGTSRRVTNRSAGSKESTTQGGGQAAKSASPGGLTRASAGTASHVAQVRLQADEMEALREVMRQLGLPSTSEALREGIRLLIRDATEIAASEEIRRFYGEQAVPLPDGVIPATKEELAAADAEQW